MATETAMFAAGCFWGVEAHFAALAGVAMKAPKFEGNFWDKERTVTLGFGGKDAKAKFDDAYFIESIRQPLAKVVKSAAAPMPPPPAVNDDEMKALIAYVKSLSDGTAPAAGGIVAKGALQNFRYRVYNGSWNQLPDFEKLKPVATGEAKSGIADTSFSKKRDNFGLVIEGELEIKTKGKYTFNLGSDDGSRLLVNGRPVVINDGVHGVVNKSGAVNLDAGIALVRIEFFEKGGGEHLSLDMSGPGIKKLQLARNTAPQGGKKPAIATGNPINPVNNEAVMYRNFIQGASPRGIGVGYPEKMNFCFDANAMNIVMAWHGAFMDAARHWNGRGQGFQRPSGHYLIHLTRDQPFAQLDSADAAWPRAESRDTRAKGLQFRGYQLVEKRRPVFMYEIGERLKVVDFIVPRQGPLPSIIRMLGVNGTGEVWYLAAAAKTITEENGGYNIGGSMLRVSFPGLGAKPIIRDNGGRQELLIKLDVVGQASIQQQYEWKL